MNLSTLYLSLALGIGFYPRFVDAYDVRLSLFEQPSSLLDQFFGEEDPTQTFSSMIRRQEQAFDRAFSSLRGSSSLGGFLDSGHFGLPSISSSLFSSSASSSSPSYEVVDDKESFTVNVHLPPSVQPNDVNIQFDEESRKLTISGHQESKNEETGYLFSSSFSRSFSLDPFVQGDQLTATVQVQNKGEDKEADVILQVSAPKDVDRMEHAVRSIPIAPYTTTTVAKAAAALEDGDRVDDTKVVVKPAVAAAMEAAETAKVSKVLQRVEKARRNKQRRHFSAANHSDAVSEENEEANPKGDDLPQNPMDRLKTPGRKSELRRRR